MFWKSYVNWRGNEVRKRKKERRATDADDGATRKEGVGNGLFTRS